MLLTKKENELLMSLVNNNRCFDRRDNTILLSNRQLAVKLKVSPSTIDRLIRKLTKNDLIRKVKPYTDNPDYYLMLSPKFLFISYTKSDRWLIGALWELRDIGKVYEWSRLCRDLNCFIDTSTGEIKSFNWYEIDRKSDQYTSFDRCYRKGSKCIYTKDDHEYSTQNYNILDVDSHDLTTYDYIWIDSLVGWSDLPYNRNMSFYTKVPKNIYAIELEYDPEITRCIQQMIDNGEIIAKH